MAKNITAQALGGTAKVIEANTVKDAFDALGLSGNYTASINGDAASMDDELEEYNFVTFAQAVKGGNTSRNELAQLVQWGAKKQVKAKTKKPTSKK